MLDTTFGPKRETSDFWRGGFFSSCYGDHRDLHSFPTRRSSDLQPRWPDDGVQEPVGGLDILPPALRRRNLLVRQRRAGDRKSTRLNSSHVEISYAVFCMKKKR